MAYEIEDETEIDTGDEVDDTEFVVSKELEECCSYYSQGTAEIDRFIKNVSIGDRYRGRPFEYCPWCGAKI